MLDDVLGWLRCPVCGGGLSRAGGSLTCPSRHSFDSARHGYVSLRPPGPARTAGDTAAMVRARSEFLSAGHFAGLAAVLAGAAAARAGGYPDGSAAPGCVLDVGAGTGYYLAAVLDRLPRHAGLALDISRYALRQAARAHPRAAAVGCDAWRRLPVADGAADLVLNVFAPRDGAELRRVLRPGGHLLLVTPAADHLAELIGPLGLLTVDPRKRERLAGQLSPHFRLVSETGYRDVRRLGHQAVTALVAMGPSAWHADRVRLAARIEELPEPVAVTLAVTLSVLRPAGQP